MVPAALHVRLAQQISPLAPQARQTPLLHTDNAAEQVLPVQHASPIAPQVAVGASTSPPSTVAVRVVVTVLVTVEVGVVVPVVVWVRVLVAVPVGVTVLVLVAVAVGVTVLVLVAVPVGVTVLVLVAVPVGVTVLVGASRTPASVAPASTPASAPASVLDVELPPQPATNNAAAHHVIHAPPVYPDNVTSDRDLIMTVLRVH
jgi:hypothetical protein